MVQYRRKDVTTSVSLRPKTSSSTLRKVHSRVYKVVGPQNTSQNCNSVIPIICTIFTLSFHASAVSRLLSLWY